LAPKIDKLAERYQGRIIVAKFDVGETGWDKGVTLREQYQIKGIPHVMLFKDGEPRAQFTGSQTQEAEFAAAIDRILQ